MWKLSGSTDIPTSSSQKDSTNVIPEKREREQSLVHLVFLSTLPRLLFIPVTMQSGIFHVKDQAACVQQETLQGQAGGLRLST